MKRIGDGTGFKGSCPEKNGGTFRDTKANSGGKQTNAFTAGKGGVQSKGRHTPLGGRK